MKVLVRGGGDLASGSVMRMRRVGWQVLVAELAQPVAVRRLVSFAQAVYDGQARVEEVTARLASTIDEAFEILGNQQVAVLVDPDGNSVAAFQPDVVVDARMLKKAPPQAPLSTSPLLIGLGPGFTAGTNCHAVVETMRGPFLGRVIWQGSAQADTGAPEQVKGFENERVLRAPAAGSVRAIKEIGDTLRRGEPVVEVGGSVLHAPFDGMLRGLIQDNLWVEAGEKIGDVDPRNDRRLCALVSDKALAIGGGVLEAILVWQFRRQGGAQ